ncbi:hypothetical protein, partial [Enterobacter sp. R1(2018)]|uniref:hypothetical protein n=1 Tax=Enterobacter sp. R1(2018) TaxID=2447891 RepID=UPI00217CC507
EMREARRHNRGSKVALTRHTPMTHQRRPAAAGVKAAPKAGVKPAAKKRPA